MSASTKPRYRVPVHCVEAEVSLDEFSDDDIAEYLRHRGYSVVGVPGNGGQISEGSDLDHIFTLALCGQREQAIAEALALVSKAIGRPL